MSWKNKSQPKGDDVLDWIRDNVRTPRVQAVGLKMLQSKKDKAKFFGDILLELHDMERSI